MGYCDQALMWQTYPLNVGYMFHNNNNNRVTPEEQYGPRIAGEILREYLENSNDPLAVAYRERIADSEEDDDEDQLFKDIHPNTELGIDLKILTRKPGRLPVGVPVKGSIVNDGSDHFTFLQDAHKVKKVVANRTSITIRGQYVNLHVKLDGTYCANLRRPVFSKDFTFHNFLLGAAEELQYFASLVGKR